MGNPVHNTLHRFVEGIGTVGADDPFRALTVPDPTKWAVWFDDFLDYDVAQGDTKYTLSQSGGTDSVAGPTGVLSLTLGGSDNQYAHLYLTSAPFQTNSKKLIWECRCKVQKGSGGTINAEEVFVGLASVQTTTNFMAADGLSRTMDDAMGFISYDATLNIDAIQGENDVFSTEAAAAVYADDTWMKLGGYYDGAQTFFYKDDGLVATLTANEPTSVVTPTMYVKAGEAKAKVLLVDYFAVFAER